MQKWCKTSWSCQTTTAVQGFLLASSAALTVSLRKGCSENIQDGVGRRVPGGGLHTANFVPSLWTFNVSPSMPLRIHVWIWPSVWVRHLWAKCFSAVASLVASVIASTCSFLLPFQKRFNTSPVSHYWLFLPSDCIEDGSRGTLLSKQGGFWPTFWKKVLLAQNLMQGVISCFISTPCCSWLLPTNSCT